MYGSLDVGRIHDAPGREFADGLAKERVTHSRKRGQLRRQFKAKGIRTGGSTVFDFGEWKSEVASRKNPDGSISFLTTAPGAQGFEFVVRKEAKRTLITRDGQHDYVFDEQGT